MKHQASLVLTVTTTVFCLFLCLRANAQIETDYVYGYVVNSLTDNQIEVHFVDNPEVHTFPLGASERLRFAELTPVSGWLMAALTSPADSIVRFHNLGGDEQREFEMYLRLEYNQAYDHQGVAFSPDGQFAAMVGSQAGEQDLYLYSIATDTLTNVTHDGAEQQRVAWSNDGSSMAVSSVECVREPDTRQQCSVFLDIINVNSMSRQFRTVLFEDAMPELGTPNGQYPCQLTWSPDNLYIAYVAACDLSLISAPKEVFLVETTTGTLRRVTNYTTDAIEPLNSPYLIRSGVYDLVWRSSDTLIISAAYITPENSAFAAPPETRYHVDQEIVAYTVSSDSSQVITPDVAAQSLTIRPCTGELTYFAVAEANSTLLSIEAALQIMQPESPYQVSVLSISESGCNLNWSPDGTQLAYLLLDQESLQCGLFNGLRIIDATGHILATEVLDNNVTVYDEGWVPLAAIQ